MTSGNDTNAPSAGGITLRGLTKSFSTPTGTIRAVDGIDLTITAGETVALLGPNGAGKSTTIDMILGLTPPDAGDAFVFGMRPHEAIAAGAIGGMLQTGAVIKDLSVREIITMVASLYPHPLPVDEVMEMAGITDLDGRKTTRLSGGQTQRVRAAMALVSNPDLLLLDEPTVALDVQGRHDFWTTVRSFASRGKTVLFATHYLEEADAYADRIVLMARGHIVADGPANEIKASVSVRTIRASVPDLNADQLSALPTVSAVEPRGESVVLTCSDSDAALRALLRASPAAHGIEVAGAGLDQAFLQLTADTADTDDPTAASVEPVTEGQAR